MTKNFKLQSVLNYRRIREAEARRRLAEALEHERFIRRKIAENRDRLGTLCRELEDRQQQGISLADLLLHMARIEDVEARLKNMEKDLERFRREVEDSRESLCEASRDKKLLERLKEKREEEQGQLINRQENIALDEISLRFVKGGL
jgi:flagellar FliJ protein